MVDRFLGRFIPKRNSFDIRGTINDILNLFKSQHPENKATNTYEEDASSFAFNIDDKIPSAVVTYSQEIV